MNNSQLPSNSVLTNNLTDVLRSAFSETFPDAYATYLKSVIQSFNRSSGSSLLTSSGTSIAPLLFNNNPDENFPNKYGKFTDTLSTGSDINIVGGEGDEDVKLIWGRHGSDSLVGFDPGIDYVGKRRIDVFTGDLTDEQLFALSTGREGSFQEWKDRFILGDWQQAYYVENDPQTLGLNQFALITDFNPNQDVIQLHGTSQDYQLVNTSLGTAIFWHGDLIGVTGGVFDLSIQSDYFDFKGNTVPETVLDDAQHIGTPAIDYLFASSVDAEGNLYVGGGTDGSLGGNNLGTRDSWLTKYDNNGNQLWSRQFGTTGTENIRDMASDGSNIYVVGNTSGELDNNTSQGGNDLYLAKYDSDGNQKWIKQFGTTTYEEASSVSTDTYGNIYVSGHTIGSLAGPNQNVGQNLVANSIFLGYPSTDSYVAKFDSNGNQQWIKQFGTPALDDNWGVATDKDGNIFAGGNTKGNFGGKNAGSAAEYDAWLLKLDKDGNQQWVKQFGSPNYDFLWDVKTDSIGNIYATGWTLGDLAGKNAGSFDVWLAKYDTNGNQQWINQFGTSGDDAVYMNGLSVDSNDNVFLAGYTDGNLGGENSGGYDSWVAKFDSNGNQDWIKQFGTSDYDTATTISADTYGNFLVSGITEGSLGDTNAGSYDSWVVKLDTNEGTIQNFTGNNYFCYSSYL
ncbi:hemolysin-type calcium-binding region [Calothrix sp. NIES-4071]|nr:hemolysin-type calcium-binding region [Calothrix sp. NIES-4071]BAZ54954.1 hemolysin-type calcium-binding region [Calothrix sp. NIES-4105]